jgi:hypothetical protein
MKFLFEDDTFAFETPRTTGFANCFGADLGEVLTADGELHAVQVGLDRRVLAATHKTSQSLREGEP